MDVASKKVILMLVKKVKEGAEVPKFMCVKNQARFVFPDPLVDFVLEYVNVGLQSTNISMRFGQFFCSSKELQKLSTHSSYTR